jgi:hypothetical protein
MSSVDLAIDYARKAVQTEARGPGDLEDAMRRLEATTGVGYWTWWGLWNKRRKLVDHDLFQRVRGAYLDLCKRQLSKAQHVLAIEAAKGSADDLQDLAAEARALAAKIEEAIDRQKVGRS